MSFLYHSEGKLIKIECILFWKKKFFLLTIVVVAQTGCCYVRAYNVEIPVGDRE